MRKERQVWEELCGQGELQGGLVPLLDSLKERERERERRREKERERERNLPLLRSGSFRP